MCLAMLAFSLLMDQLGQNRAKAWAVLRETLRFTIVWAIGQATDYSRSYDHIMTGLCLA